MTPFAEVPTPAELTAPVDPRLGRLAGPLRWLASTQGSWPPRVPQQVRTVGPEDDAATADAFADAGADLLVLAASGDDAPGTVVAAALLDLEPVTAIGTGSAPDWAARLVAVRTGLRACRPHLGDPRALLDAVGSPPLTRLTGLLAQAAVRRTPVLLDGSALACGAALVAQRLAPGARQWWLAGARPVVPAASLALERLHLAPLLELDTDLPGSHVLAQQLLLGAVELAS